MSETNEALDIVVYLLRRHPEDRNKLKRIADIVKNQGKEIDSLKRLREFDKMVSE